jgi:hypothetical protein
MNKAQKLEKLSSFKGHLDKIERELEGMLTEEEYFDLCDNTSSVSAYIKLAIKRLKDYDDLH